MKIVLNFVFDRKKHIKSEEDKGLIEIRAYFNYKYSYHSTKIFVHAKDWQADKERINPKIKNANFWNDELDSMIEQLNAARREADYKKLPFGLEQFKQFFKPEASLSSFSAFAKKEIEENNFIKEVTKHSQRNTIRRMIAFCGKDDVLYTDLTPAFMINFINYLKGSGIAQNTLRKHNKNAKSLIEKAIKKGYFSGQNPCKEIKIKEVETRMDVLTMEEIKKIIHLKFEAYEKNLETARDMFIFSCCTGLRVSDVTHLKPEYIKRTPDGTTLDFYTMKVNKHAIIPLNKLFPLPEENTSLPLKILNKYYNADKPFVFPQRTDQVINRHLKTIGEMVGIKFKLTSHIGRKSFATHMARLVSTPTLKRLLQHSNIKTTERYVHLSDKMVNEDLDKINWGS